MFKKRTIAIILLCFIGYISGSAQNTPLEEYIAIGLENNEELIREQLQTQIQSEVLREAKGKFLPDLTFDASYIRAEGGRIIAVPAGDLVNPIYDGLNQVIGSEVYPTNIPNVEEQFLPDDFHETKLRLIQPLLNTDIIYNKRIQESKLSAQEAKRRAYENQLVKEIKVAYYRHLSAREQSNILKSTLSILQELVRVSESQVANDKATREVVYGAETELNNLESQIANSVKRERVSGLFFNYLIGRELGAEILEENETGALSALTNLDELTSSALSQREELKQIQFGLEATESATLMKRRFMVPELSLIGDAGYQGFGYEFDETQDFWFLRLGLTVPIFQGNQNRARIQQAAIQEKVMASQLRETNDLIALEVAEAFYAVEAAQKNLQSRKSSKNSAKENFRIIQKKYEQNQVLQVEFNDARNSLTNAQLLETIAEYNLKIRIAELEAAAAFQN